MASTEDSLLLRNCCSRIGGSGEKRLYSNVANVISEVEFIKLSGTTGKMHLSVVPRIHTRLIKTFSYCKYSRVQPSVRFSPCPVLSDSVISLYVLFMQQCQTNVARWNCLWKRRQSGKTKQRSLECSFPEHLTQIKATLMSIIPNLNTLNVNLCGLLNMNRHPRLQLFHHLITTVLQHESLMLQSRTVAAIKTSFYFTHFDLTVNSCIIMIQYCLLLALLSTPLTAKLAPSV